MKKHLAGERIVRTLGNASMHHALAALALALMLHAPSTSAAESKPNVVAFIGRLVSIRELPDQCPNADAPEGSAEAPKSICIQLDSIYEATYEVVEVLGGTLRSTRITFNVADHYGFPGFADFQNALLFVNIGPGESWLEKYQGYAVHRTSNADWAACGNPYNGPQAGISREPEAVSFAHDFGIVGNFSSEGVAHRFFDSDEMVVDQGRIVCRRGVYAHDLYEMVRTGVLSERGIELPALDARRHEIE